MATKSYRSTLTSTRLMLSRFVSSARNILPLRIPKLQEQSNSEEGFKEPAMVTTRRQSGIQAAHAEKTSPRREEPGSEAVTESSRKRRKIAKEGDVEEAIPEGSSPVIGEKSPAPTKEKDDEHFERHTHFAVEIPVSKFVAKGVVTLDVEEKSIPKPTSEVAGTKVIDTVFEDAVLSSQPAQEAASDSVARPTSEAVAPKKPKRSGKRAPQTKSKSTTKSELASTTKASTPAKPKHKRFGSEEPEKREPEIFMEQERETNDSQDEAESSDDDAPEVVATQHAQEEVFASAHNAAKAVEKQDAITRKKRKERDQQLKQQAQAASKKRKRGIERVRSAPPITGGLDVEQDEKHTAGIKSIDQEKPSTTKPNSKLRISRSNLPDLLPEEYLQDDDTDTNKYLLPSTGQDLATQKPNKTKFADLNPKRPRDRVKGSTIFRVTEGRGDGVLTPKATYGARAMKEAWLSGRRGVREGERGAKRIVGAGFFRK